MDVGGTNLNPLQGIHIYVIFWSPSLTLPAKAVPSGERSGCCLFSGVLSIPQDLLRHIGGSAWIRICEGCIWTWLWPILKWYPRISLEGLRKTNLNEDRSVLLQRRHVSTAKPDCTLLVRFGGFAMGGSCGWSSGKLGSEGCKGAL
jgi:hypothetical protein